MTRRAALFSQLTDVRQMRSRYKSFGVPSKYYDTPRGFIYSHSAPQKMSLRSDYVTEIPLLCLNARSLLGGIPNNFTNLSWMADSSARWRLCVCLCFTITMHSVRKHPRIAGPVGAGLGRFSGYRPTNGLPFSLRLTARSINDITINAHTKTVNKPAIRSGFSRNIGVTASGPFKLPIRFSTLICSRYFASVAPNGN